MVEIKAEIGGPGAEALKEIASGGRGALRRAFGSALTEFGEMLSDQMKLWRFKNLMRIRDKVDRLAIDRQIPDSLLQALPFGDAMRTLDAASQEDEDDIQEIWAKLIVKAVSEAQQPSINKLNIEILRSLTPADSALLELLHPTIIGRTFHTRGEVKALSDELNAKADGKWRRFSLQDRSISVQNLSRLRCITATPRMFEAQNLLINFADRERRHNGALVDKRGFEELLSKLVTMIYQTSGALPYDATTPLPLHHLGGMFGNRLFDEIDVPELNHMLSPLGLQFMDAVTLAEISA